MERKKLFDPSRIPKTLENLDETIHKREAREQKEAQEMIKEEKKRQARSGRSQNQAR